MSVLTPEKERRIKELTGLEYHDILKMTPKDFFLTFGRLVSKKKITMKQFQWLQQQRELIIKPVPKEITEIFPGATMLN